MTAHLEFGWPLLLCLLPLPLLARMLLPACRLTDDTLWLPLLDDFVRLDARRNRMQRHLPMLMMTLAWLLLIVAACRPLWVSERGGTPVSGRDLILAIDLSESMHQTDFELGGRVVNRLEASKQVARDFIEQRTGDRIGMVVFGTQAYFYTPMTLDRETVQILLDETTIGLAGSKTAIGDAIGLVVKRLRDNNAKQRVLILMTDGANTAGDVSPLIAARLARDNEVRVYTIGIGRAEESIGRGTSQTLVHGLDEATLQQIAELTGGEYYRASETASLRRIYAEIDKLEPVINLGDILYEYTELYPWPLGLAVALVLWAYLYRYARQRLLA